MTTVGFPRRVRPGRAAAGVLCAAGILVLAGCGGGPKVAKVTGTVYDRDKPYAHTIVYFFADSPGGQTAEAETGPDGSFSLKTYLSDGREVTGVIPGRYKVGIRLNPKGPDVRLTKYGNAKTSPIAVDVPPEGLADYEVRLK
jgi:hypothetical protein